MSQTSFKILIASPLLAEHQLLGDSLAAVAEVSSVFDTQRLLKNVEGIDLLVIDDRLFHSGLDKLLQQKNPMPMIVLGQSIGVDLWQRWLERGVVDVIDVKQPVSLQSLRIQQHLQYLKSKQLLSAQSRIDVLTGVSNRRKFDEMLALEWRQAKRKGSSLALLMMDIDHFKLYNDHYGHQMGDACIRQVAQVLDKTAGRPRDLMCRYGGEEFVAILPDTDLAGANYVAELMRLKVENLRLAHRPSPVMPFVTLSIGVSVSSIADVNDATELVAAADKALYGAKGAGRNRIMSSDTALLLDA